MAHPLTPRTGCSVTALSSHPFLKYGTRLPRLRVPSRRHLQSQTAWGHVTRRPVGPAAFMGAAQGPTAASSRGRPPHTEPLDQHPATRAASAVAEGLWDQLTFLTAFLLAFFPAWVLGAAALGFVRPAAFAWFNATSATSALSIAMFFMGLSLSLEDLKRVAATPRRICAGLALQYTLMPFLAAVLSRLLGLPSSYAIGLCLVGVCSGGSTAVAATYLARADVTLSLVMTAGSMLLGLVASPLITQLLLGKAAALSAGPLISSTLQVTLLPALAGLALAEAFPHAVAKMRPLCALSAIGLVTCTSGSNVANTAHILLRVGPRVLAAVLLLHSGGFLLGAACSRALGLPERTARTFAFQLGMRNSALAALLAALHFPGHPLAAVPCALSACVHTILGCLVAAWWRWRVPGSEPRGAQQAQQAQQMLLLAPLVACVGALWQTYTPQLLGTASSLLAATLEQLEVPQGQAQELSLVGAPPARQALPTAVSLPVAVLELPAVGLSSNEAPKVAEPPLPPPPNPNAMNIIMVGAECAPWSKTGGLGDVMQALPKALAARGHRVMVVAPRYQPYEDAWETGIRLRLRVFASNQEVGYFHAFQDGVDYCFVDHPAYHRLGREIYGGSRHELLFRCALLAKAALEAPWQVACGGAPYGESKLVFVANDWHASLLPVYLQAHFHDHGKLSFARSLLIVHNIAHQGRGPLEDLGWLEVPDQYVDHFRLWDANGGEHMNIMKAGAITANRIVAVSSRYAGECQTQEQGFGLDSIMREQSWKLTGVVNGIDYTEWHPASDPHLQRDGYANYDLETLTGGKARCKAALQKELGLPVNPDAPLLGFIGRLDSQKGVDLIVESYDWLLGEGAQLVLLGSGREDLEAALRDMERRHPDKCRAWVGFSVKLAHRITAGVDLLLMPSRFEPCGLNQLYAMAYGTPPVVHAVGGLADTVKPFNPYQNTGTGWSFNQPTAAAFRRAMGDAMYTYRQYRESFRDIQLRCMQQDLSWDNAAQQYEEVLLAARHQ